MKQLLALLLLLVCSSSYGQILIDEKFEQYQPVEFSFQASESSQAIWDIKPLSNQTRFSTRRYGNVYAFWGEPGRYQIEATVVTVDFDARTFDIQRYSKMFEIVGNAPVPPVPPGPTPPGPNPPGPVPPGPNPPAPPNPSVPEDSFNNIGRRVDAAATTANLQMDRRFKVSEIYQGIAKDMFPPNQKFVKIEDVRKELISRLNALQLDGAWAPIIALINEEASKWSGDKLMSWQDANRFYLAVAEGYKGGPL
jgi:hypothetical protein